MSADEVLEPDVTDAPGDSGWTGRIEDDAQAMWAISKLGRARAEIARLRRNAQDLIDQIQRKALADEATAAHDETFFEGLLIDYRSRLEAERPIKGPYRLPNGSIRRRTGRESTKVVDAEAFIAWCETEDMPDAVKRTPLVSALRGWPRVDGRIVSRAGEVVPGVEVVIGEDSFTVEVDVAEDGE